MKRLISSIAALALAGCATEAGLRSKLDSFVGRPVQELIASNGPPTSDYKMGGTGRALIYTRSGTAYLPGHTYTVPVTSTTTGTISQPGRIATPFQATTTTYQPVQSPGVSVNLSCSVTFFVSDAGLVESYAFYGNNCVSR